MIERPFVLTSRSKRVIFLATTTITVPPQCVGGYGYVTGAGQAGQPGAAAADSTHSGVGGAGGNGGGYSEGPLFLAPGSSLVVTVGTGGAATAQGMSNAQVDAIWIAGSGR